jgi:hypothetical protein
MFALSFLVRQPRGMLLFRLAQPRFHSIDLGPWRRDAVP